MIPQGPFSPFHQQRWVEIYNDGAATIPGRGIAEIVESYRPDSGSVETPLASGRTVLKVRQPTVDNATNFVINGPLSIAAGKTGFGTMDYPAWALYDTTVPVNGEAWGPQSGSCVAKKGNSGLVVHGDAIGSTGSGFMRVGRVPTTKNICYHVTSPSAVVTGGLTLESAWGSPTVDIGGLFSLSGVTLTVIKTMTVNEILFHIDWMMGVYFTVNGSSIYSEATVVRSGIDLGVTAQEFTSPAGTTSVSHAHVGFYDAYLNTGDTLKLQCRLRAGALGPAAIGRIRVTPVFPV